MSPSIVRLLPAILVATFAALAGCDRFRSAPLGAQPDPADSTWAWVHVPDAAQYTDGEGIVADDGGVFIVGYQSRGFQGDGGDVVWGGHALLLRGEMSFFVARHGTDGAVRWARSYGDGGQVAASAIARAPDGGLYVTGTMSRSIFTDSVGRWAAGGRTLVTAAQRAFLARLDSTGTVAWARFVDGAADAQSVAVDGAGRVYVAGGTVERVGSAPGGGPAIADSGDAYVASYSADGTPRWFRIVARGGYATAYSVAGTRDGVCVVGGFGTPDTVTFAGEARRFSVGHGFVTSLDAAGAHRWTDTLSSRHHDPSRPERSTGGGPTTITTALDAVASDAGGACYAAGQFSGVLHVATDTLVAFRAPGVDPAPHGFTDVVIVKYDRGGRRMWGVRGIGGPSSDITGGIAVAADGRVVVAGTFMGEGSFGPYRLSLPAREPMVVDGRLVLAPRGLFVATLGPDGKVRSAVQNLPDETIMSPEVAVSRDGVVYVTGTQDRRAVWGHIAAPTRGINAFVARMAR